MIPRLWVFAAFCAMATSGLGADEPLSFDELLKLEGAEFEKAADQNSAELTLDRPYTAEQLITIAERLIPSVKPLGEKSATDHGMSPFHSYFSEACRKADDKQLDNLIGIYCRLEAHSFEKSYDLPPLASRVLARDLKAMSAQRVELRANEADPKVPEALEAAPEELQKAWRTFKRSQAAFDKAFPQATEQVEVYANIKSFYKLIGDVLAGATGLEDEIRRYGSTGPNCLGITEIEDAQDIASLLMLMREGRTREAIGAALRVVGTEGSGSTPDALAKPVFEFLERSGVDWEEVLAGGQADREARGWEHGGSAPYLAALAKYGSARSAALVKQLAFVAKPESREKYVAVLGAWIETASKLGKCYGQESSQVFTVYGSYSDREAKPMPMAVQESALRAIEKLATPESSETLATEAIKVFGRTQARSSIPVLQSLTRHRSSSVARDATIVLCAMGLETKIPAEGTAVRFQILANGQPLPAEMEVAWQVFAEAGNVSSHVRVQSDGLVELPRRHFTNPDRPATGVAFEMTGAVDGAVVFATKLSPPWNLDGTTKIELKVSSLEITLRNKEGLNAPAPDKAFVALHRVTDEKQDAQEIPYRSWTGSSLFRPANEISATPAIRFPSIEEGKYKLWIGVPGGEIWSQVVTVGAKNSKVDAVLKPASDVCFAIVTPNGQRSSWAPLFKDGKEMNLSMDTESYSYRSLPCGRYVLRVPGSEGLKETDRDRKVVRGPDEIPFKGRDVEFIVEKGSPTVIDLGEIHLEPLPR